MYRKHKTALPANNLYLKHKWDIYEHEFHRHRVRTITAKVDSKPPRTFMHMFINLKKLQGEQERISEIQKENKVLIDHIANIMRGTGYVDHRNEYKPKSLNCWKRQNEMLHLAYDNLTQHRRLLDVHPTYNHNRLEDSFMLHQKYKANIQKYPSNWKELVKEEEIMRKEMRKMFLKKEERMRRIKGEAPEKLVKIGKSSERIYPEPEFKCLYEEGGEEEEGTEEKQGKEEEEEAKKEESEAEEEEEVQPKAAKHKTPFYKRFRLFGRKKKR